MRQQAPQILGVRSNAKVFWGLFQSTCVPKWHTKIHTSGHFLERDLPHVVEMPRFWEWLLLHSVSQFFQIGQINVYSWLGINWLNLTKKNNSILFLKCTFCFWTWHLLLQFTHYAIQQLMRDFKYLFWLSIDFLHCLNSYICLTGEILWRPVCYGLQPPSNDPESTEVETGTLL